MPPSGLLDSPCRGIDLTKKVPEIDARLNKARSEYSDFSLQVTAIRGEQLDLLKQARALQANLSTAFGQAFEVYLVTLKTERTTNPRIIAFRQEVLLPTAAWLNWLPPQEDSEVDAVSWQRLLAYSWGKAVTSAKDITG